MPDLNSSKWPAYIRMSTLLPLWVSCVWSIFFCAVLCVLSSVAIILIGQRELVALLQLFFWCLVFVLFSSSRYVGGSAVCDCCISRSYSLTFLYQSMEKGFTDSLQLSGKIESFDIKYRALKIFFLWTSTKQRIKVLAKGHNKVPPTATCLEIDTLRSSVQRSSKRATQGQTDPGLLCWLRPISPYI